MGIVTLFRAAHGHAQAKCVPVHTCARNCVTSGVQVRRTGARQAQAAAPDKAVQMAASTSPVRTSASSFQKRSTRKPCPRRYASRS